MRTLIHLLLAAFACPLEAIKPEGKIVLAMKQMKTMKRRN